MTTPPLNITTSEPTDAQKAHVSRMAEFALEQTRSVMSLLLVVQPNGDPIFTACALDAELHKRVPGMLRRIADGIEQAQKDGLDAHPLPTRPGEGRTR